MSYLSKKRNKFNVSAEGSVDIRVDLANDAGSSPRVWLQCTACGDELHRNIKRNLFECPGCGYDLTFSESNSLAKTYIDSICRNFDITFDGKKGFLWRFISFFGIKKRLPAPKS